MICGLVVQRPGHIFLKFTLLIMNKSTLYILLLILFGMTYQSCSIEDDIVCCTPPPELITSVNVSLVSQSDTLTLSFSDLDGEGGNDGVVEGGILDANTTYSFATSFLNESTTPAEDITEEVREEGTDHFVDYQSGTLGFTVVRTDVDDDGNPIGLTGTFTTGDAGTGELQVILLHEPIKTADAATGGETDIEVGFPIVVE